MKPRLLVLAASFLAIGFPLSPARANEVVEHQMKLIMTMAGIPIGKLALTMKLIDGEYAMEGSARTYGASRIFSDAKGFSKSTGRYETGRIIAARHELNYRASKKTGSVNIRFTNGNVSSAKSVPPVVYKVGTVKLEKSQLNNVLDPVSTSIVTVKKDQIDNGPAICNRTLPVYDGKNRFDLRMKFKGIRKLTTKGFNGVSYVCSARYVPVAGHRPSKKHIQRLMNNKTIEIALARIGNTSVYGLIQFSVRTRYGKIIGKPSYFRTIVK